VTKPNNALWMFWYTRKGNHSVFLTPTVIGKRRPLPSETCAQSDHPFEKRRLRQISLIILNRKRYSEKSSIMTNEKSTTGFPTSYRWSAYCIRNPYVPQRVNQKAIFCFLNKIQFQSNKVCYKVSMCENFQRQRYSITTPLSQTIDIVAKSNLST